MTKKEDLTSWAHGKRGPDILGHKFLRTWQIPFLFSFCCMNSYYGRVLLICFCFVLCAMAIIPGKAHKENKREIQEDIDEIIRLNSDAGGKVTDSFVTWIESADREELRKSAGGMVVNENCYIPTGRTSCAPQFIIAGSMKCGTTSLHTYLLDHPQVLPIKGNGKLNGREILAQKEIRYFIDPLFSTLHKRVGPEGAKNQYFDLFENMPAPGNNKEKQLFSGDATPMYVCQPTAAKRAYSTLPEAKVIIMARNPVDRMYSEFWFRASLKSNSHSSKQNQDSFASCIRTELKKMEYCGVLDVARNLTLSSITEFNSCVKTIGSKATRDRCKAPEYEGMCVPTEGAGFCVNKAVANSFYAAQILSWQELYGDRLLVVNSDEFYAHTPSVMNRIADFIGLDEFDWEPITKQAFNIVSPKANPDAHVVSNNHGGLFVGEMSADKTSSYPPLDKELRAEFENFFDPLNQALTKLIGQPDFWSYSYKD
uniref:Sulfotransferase domain-containing protein n=1 Tax=Vannella robusta TaxID=1487602 RepID=A0A7S4ILP2_9EUKA|mmetsp:Transcript_4736/g.5753  ORF Transcript_4736/g.5753 Transcript_4736/m.5753 type:complete len:482 (+) Transcript_4736:174-1619(+)